MHNDRDGSNRGNYGPLSLTSIVLKDCERGLGDWLVNHLEGDKLTVVDQHGSCSTNFLSTLGKVTGRMNKCQRVEACYLDFQKAFGLAKHKLLEKEAKAFRVNAEVNCWRAQSMKDRHFRVSGGVSLRRRFVVQRGSSWAYLGTTAIPDVRRRHN